MEKRRTPVIVSVDDHRPIAVTGGLPFFGGPGNNYSLHAIAEMVGRIRSKRHHRTRLTSVGWYNTKWSVGIYGGENRSIKI